MALVPPAEAQATLESEITAEVTRYVATVNGGDPRAVTDLYVRKPGVSSAGDGEITVGWSDILALYQNFKEQFGRVTMSVDLLAVVPVGRDGAVAVFRYRWVGVRNRDTISTDGAMTLVYERTAQGWRIVHDHTSTRTDEPGRAQSSTGERGDFARPGSSALVRSAPPNLALCSASWMVIRSNVAAA